MEGLTLKEALKIMALSALLSISFWGLTALCVANKWGMLSAICLIFTFLFAGSVIYILWLIIKEHWGIAFFPIVFFWILLYSGITFIVKKIKIALFKKNT